MPTNLEPAIPVLAQTWGKMAATAPTGTQEKSSASSHTATYMQAPAEALSTLETFASVPVQVKAGGLPLPQREYRRASQHVATLKTMH